MTGAAATWSRTASAKALGAILADPSDGRGGQLDPKKVGHQCGKTLFGQQLVVQQIHHERTDPFAVLHRGGHSFGERRPRLRATGSATAVVRAMFGDKQRLRFRQIEHLPGDMGRRHRSGQRFATRSAGFWIMIDSGIGFFNPAKRLARMALLPAGLLTRWFPQAADARRLTQPVAGRWLAAIAAVQSEAPFQFRQPPRQRRILGAKQRNLNLQCRYDRIATSRGRAIVSGGCVVGRRHRHVDCTAP